MSLVEQAIARLRQGTVDGAMAKELPRAPASRSDEAPTSRSSETGGLDSNPASANSNAGVTREPLAVDLEVLRTRGYLPEANIDRRLADHYRHIKRPIVEKAAAAPEPNALDPRIIMVTSALPGDGKTFTSLNLAFSLARERDFSVLLIDADTPKPHVTDIFALRDEPGLGDALLDEHVQIESLIVPTTVRGFSILTAGRSCPGAAELLLSNRMRELMASLIRTNPRRLVLLDSAPLLPTSEGRALLKVAGQAVLVVRAGQTPRSAVRDAVALMGKKKGVGIVLNEGEASFTEGYYGYGEYGNRPA